MAVAVASKVTRKGSSSVENTVEPLLTNFNPEDFLVANKNVSELSLKLLKNIYDFTKSGENNGSLDDPLGLHTDSLKVPIRKKWKKKLGFVTISKAEAPLTRLITQDFDEDQIWEELELQNMYLYDNLVTSVSKLLSFQEKPIVNDNDSDSRNDDDDAQLESVLEADNIHDVSKEDDDESDFFESDKKHRKKATKAKMYQKSIVDDKFFNLAQMTEYLEQVEAEIEEDEIKNSRRGDNPESESSDDEDAVDLFEDIPNEEEEPVGYSYKEFFDPPLQQSQQDTRVNEDGSGSDQDNSINLENHSFDEVKTKSVKFQLNDKDDQEQDSESSDEDEDLDDDDIDDAKEKLKPFGKQINETLSTFEKRRRKIEENIEEIENEALQPKSWHLLGEATAEGRPENALLEEHLLYDHLIRPAPEITAQTTMKLEDVIKLRIKDGAFDDVQRKIKPVEDARDYKKRLVMDAEKSKASLAEIYEQEYIDKKKAEEGETEEKEPEDHNQIKKDLQILFSKLDALSHYHYTPKPSTADIKIVANVPAISMEEVAPVSVSDANMLAPQELEGQVTGAVKGKNERTSTDRNRERRKKKKKQHLKRLNREEKAQLKGLGLRNIKLADGIIKSHQKASAEDISQTQTSKELKSSKAFFTKLQESVTTHVRTVAKRKGVPKNDNIKSAKKYKL